MSEALAAQPAESMVLAASGQPLNGVGPPEAASGGQAELVGLLHQLSDGSSGLDVVYRALAVTATQFGLQDLVVGLDNQVAGRQVFRLDRRPIGPEDLDRLGDGSTLLAVPDTVPADVASTLLAVVDAAFTTQLARHHHLRDPLTGLLARGVFNETLRSAAAQSSRYGWTFTIALMQVGDGKHTDPTEIRQFGHAFARALRSGDTGTRLQRSVFAALLPNATSESLHAFVRRFAEESSLEEATMHIASATAPNESVDPAELFRLAAARLQHD
jgi:GGDEF domain-containing protein